MHLDPLLPPLVGVISVVLILGLLFQFFRQPQLVAYIIAGVVIGPAGSGLVTDTALIEHLGALGVTLLLFFIGMEVSPRQLAKGWKIAVFGTLLQIGISVATIWLLGAVLAWSLPRIVLLGFVISLSSTAVVLKLLKDRGELESQVGRNVLLILLAQDLAVVPMLIGVSMLSGETPERTLLYKQLFGGIALLALAIWTVTRHSISLPLANFIKRDHEIQLFAALLACFGLAFISSLLGLSAALGAFVAGLIITACRETDWVHHALEPMRIVFVALLFVSMGMLIELQFVLDNLTLLLSLLLGVLITNSFINALILRLLGDPWAESLYAGALLSQVGEFSFVLATVGLKSGIISNFAYQTTIALIALSLLASPAWIALSQRLLKPYLKTSANA